MKEVKINYIDESDFDKTHLEHIYTLSKLAALDDDNPNTVVIDDTRFTGVYLKNNKLLCIKCHTPLPKLKEQLHIHIDNDIDKSIYQCSCGQYVIKTYPAKM
ncbi:hypothetical protein [Veillonella caviae]|uniref:hypothetical protein n=1 Tax=Veillonella caviae TaxID=248316 RepID=UPI0023F73589|nr:hypothetical protein [Veillonella caviae]MCI7693546.1 hypothetical protein [Veillonella caviae]MDY5253169.1 hypothetical protein [Veillonella caviae]